MASLFPLSIHSGGRHLLDAQGNPFPLLECTHQTLLTHFQQADIATYLDLAKQRGFTAVRFMLECQDGSNTFDTASEPADAYGNQPFSTTGWLDTVNQAYFDNAKLAVQAMADRGLLACIFILYLGYQGGNQGWKAVLSDSHNTNTICFNYGAYVATQFTSYNNVMWWLLGDNGGSSGADALTGTELTRYLQIVAGVQSVTRAKLNASEPAPPDTKATSLGSFTFGINPATSDQQLGTVYAAGPGANGECSAAIDAMWDTVAGGGASFPRMPVYPTDPPFYHNTWGSLNTRETNRKFQWWALTAGGFACGSHFGNDDTFNIATPATALATMSDVATLDGAIKNNFILSLPFWKMRPSGTANDRCGRTLIASGGGSGSSLINACQSVDGRYLVAYVPTTGTGTTTFSVNLSGMAGACRARWFNVTTGAYQNESTSAGAYALTQTTSQSVTTPGDNGTGSNDWILLVESIVPTVYASGRPPIVGPSGMGSSRMCGG